MACLSRHHHRAWLTTQDMVQRCPLSAHHCRLNDDADADPISLRSLSSAHRLFPVYAMGAPDPTPEPELDGPDPIWNAVRDEAKLEVNSINSLFHLVLIAFIVFVKLCNRVCTCRRRRSRF